MMNISVQQKSELVRLRLLLTGIVQGVGFRPFVYRLAKDLSLAGLVKNTPEGLMIEVEGAADRAESFVDAIKAHPPVHSLIEEFHCSYVSPSGFRDFEILPSDISQEKTTVVSPDIATCPECLREIFDSQDRRYLYPFTNCTHCGPRFSILEAVPYDRVNTTMKAFTMCLECQAEYDDPLDRRFHAQPNACPRCGPHIEFRDQQGQIRGKEHAALLRAAQAVKEGQIVAVKGIGGFHLFVDARNETAVLRLRARKHREAKPLAVMFPSMASLEEHCDVSDNERELVKSGAAPIVLLRRKERYGEAHGVTLSVALDNPYLGAMLPYSPLHHIFMSEVDFPVVATSGNLSDEPICIDEQEAFVRLAAIADVFLAHDRPIARPVDDSVIRIMADRPMVIRRSRGFAPLPLTVPGEHPSVFAVGGQMKNTVALNVKDHVFISQHIGDLDNDRSIEAFQNVSQDLRKFYSPAVTHAVCDLHPDYVSTKFASGLGLPVIKVQHHHAHIAACMAEHHLDGRVFGIAWDGTGWGGDKTVWGGEFLSCTLTDFERAGHFECFPLPGGEQAIREPRRTALGLLAAIGDGDLAEFGDLPIFREFSPVELKVIQTMITRGINAPLTSSVGRLFDGVAALLGLCHKADFEGQAAMALEYVLGPRPSNRSYEFDIKTGVTGGFVVGWNTMIRQIAQDIRGGVCAADISAKFHNTLVRAAVEMAKQGQEERVVLSGGCFQNKYLLENLVQSLIAAGFTPSWPGAIPPNDGGIAVGQAAVALHRLANMEKQARVTRH